MSTTPFPSPYPHSGVHALLHHLTAAPAVRRTKAVAQIRRRPTRAQGRALEALGHAIEYLVDSQMYFSCELSAQTDVEASQILMRASREVFLECRQIMPLGTRIKEALLRMLGWKHALDAGVERP